MPLIKSTSKQAFQKNGKKESNTAGLTVKENYGPGPRVGNRGKTAGAPRATAASPHSGRANSK